MSFLKKIFKRQKDQGYIEEFRPVRWNLPLEPKQYMDRPHAQTSTSEGHDESAEIAKIRYYPWCQDGAWWCCHSDCRNISRLDFAPTPCDPFDDVKCRACAHIMCHRCITTDIISKFTYGLEDLVTVPRFYGREGVPFFQVCSQCGLNYRAEDVTPREFDNTKSLIKFGGKICHCGHSSDYGWLRFTTGDNIDYRKNPLDCYNRAVEKWTAQENQEARDGFKPPTDPANRKVKLATSLPIMVSEARKLGAIHPIVQSTISSRLEKAIQRSTK
ncbi:hypothetical protein K505DRAFT_340435 [Melanomma pulvis-pyrius CBS 109.77]|uniref:Probable double zinc ribbon domain-containing protein n=1 Tax=Melanomma pulvis-pyrius CBS 109.77 TaxID=1314802 RepID=A0A6A6X2J8_9PLEO|nr:hypothetical protein K505DRAFT_340435 [Melanomma pulvis-pyrius CBS 109.77]